MHAWFEGGGRVSARRLRYLFFASPKKSTQKKGDPQSATPSRCEGVNLHRVGCGVRRGTHCAAVQLRSDIHGESEHEARALRRACHPATAPPQAQPAGGGQPNIQTANIHSGHCFARPGLAGASATRCANWAERSKGPCGCFAPFAPLDAPRSAAGGVACVPKDTHASLSSSPQLFERSAPARSEFCGAPRSRAPQVAPARSAGVADSGVAFSLVTFFWRRKRKLLARRATPGLRPQPEHAFPTSTPRLRQAQPERMGRRTGFDGLSLNGLKD